VPDDTFISFAKEVDFMIATKTISIMNTAANFLKVTFLNMSIIYPENELDVVIQTFEQVETFLPFFVKKIFPAQQNYQGK